MRSVDAWDMMLGCKHTLTMKRGDARLKQWECVGVKHDKEVPEVIEEKQKDGWRLHT